MSDKNKDMAVDDSIKEPVKSDKDKADIKAEELLHKAEAREKAKREKAKTASGRGPIPYIRETINQMRQSRTPEIPGELLRWCGIVLGTVIVFALLCGAIDNFIATPLVYWISGLDLGNDMFGPVDIALTIALFVFGIAAFVGVMLHSGGDTEGLSDTLADKLTGGSGQAQKNLDRITLVCIILFVLVLVAMMIVFPQGTIA